MKCTIIEVCRRVTGGIVVFFPSYKYESWFWQQVQETDFKRTVFREPQDSTSVDAVLKSYADTIKRSIDGGALLFSVVGTVAICTNTKVFYTFCLQVAN